jgi:uncharacterized membrane protein
MFLKKEGKSDAVAKIVSGKGKPDNNPVFNQDISPVYRTPQTFAQRAADKLAKWAGSWTFIMFFIIFIGFWMFLNGYYLINYGSGKPLDPFPFIMLNLILSCLAAFQAPVILMSQNRQSHLDRKRTEYDYAVNRKAEREIRELRKQMNRIERRLSGK